MTEDEVVGGHHQLNGNEFQQDPGDSKGLGSQVCCSPRGHKELDERLNNKFSFQFECLLSLCIIVLPLLNLLSNAEYNY